MENITISPYDSKWIAIFAEESALLKSALQKFQPIVEHIGSTSIPNLAAKPVVDIMVGVPALLSDEIIPAIETLGYKHWKEDTFQYERLMFAKWNEDESKRLANVHLTVVGSGFWNDQLSFRDTLRQSPTLLSEYESLKYDLAERFRSDPDGYTTAKTAFIRRVLAQGD